MLKRIPSRAGPKRVIYPSIMEAKSSTVATVTKPLVGKKASPKPTKKPRINKKLWAAIVKVKDVRAQKNDMRFEFIAQGVVQDGRWGLAQLVLWDKDCPDQDLSAGHYVNLPEAESAPAIVNQRIRLPIVVPAGVPLVKAMEPTMAMYNKPEHALGLSDWQSKCVVCLRHSRGSTKVLSGGRFQTLVLGKNVLGEPLQD